MTIRLFNTLSNTVEDLEPSDGETLRIYVCGPTVYDYGHIGNFRTFLQLDVLRRFLKQQGRKIKQVMNITDVDDKIIRNAAAAHLPIAEYTAKYERAFFQDLDALGCQRPEIVARATENIPEMVALIQRLAAKNLAYQAPDGSWYFRIAGFPEYGKLSKKDFSAISDGARVDLDEYDKDSARDFALWKAAKPGEHHWDLSLGSGRPGWHIECSAMALRYLGESFDLHAGGEDLMFPHHENEIAQSESATGKTLAYHWMHVRFLLVDGRKMSKSEGNFFTLRDLLLKGYKASAIRFLLISVPYRHSLELHHRGADRIGQRGGSGTHLRQADPRGRLGGRAECRTGSADSQGAATIHRGARRGPEYFGGASRHLRTGARRQHRSRLRASSTPATSRPSWKPCGASMRSLPSSKTAMRRFPAARWNGRKGWAGRPGGARAVGRVLA